MFRDEKNKNKYLSVTHRIVKGQKLHFRNEISLWETFCFPGIRFYRASCLMHSQLMPCRVDQRQGIMHKPSLTTTEEGTAKNCPFLIGPKTKKGYIAYFSSPWEIKREDSTLESHFKKYDDFRLF